MVLFFVRWQAKEEYYSFISELKFTMYNLSLIKTNPYILPSGSGYWSPKLSYPIILTALEESRIPPVHVDWYCTWSGYRIWMIERT